MTIVRVIDRMNIGGPAIHAVLLSRRMTGRDGAAAPSGWRTVLVTGHEEPGEGSMLDAAREAGLTPLIIPALGRELGPIRDLRAFWELCRIIWREAPSVVHTHKSKAGALGRLAASLIGVPVVVHTFHGHVLHGYFGRWKSLAFRWIERLLALMTDRIIAVSPRVKDDLVRHGVAKPERIEVIPLGLELGRFASAERGRGGLRRELGLDAGTPLVGIVARLVPIKGLEVFLGAADRALKERPNACFLIVGDGELRQTLEAEASRLGLGKACRFLGFRRDLERIYPDLDVLCLTSFNEGSPVSLIEGLASGCAVVASRIGGVPDVVRDGETGVLVPAGDAEATAEAVLELLADPARRRTLGEAGRRDVLARFSAERLVADLDALYRLLLAEKGAAAIC